MKGAFIWFRERAARRRLAEITAQTRASYETQRYVRQRSAMLSPERKAHIDAVLNGYVRPRGERAQ